MNNKWSKLSVSLLLLLLLVVGFSSVALAEGGQVSGVAWIDKNADGLYSAERILGSVSVTLNKVLEDGTSQEVKTVKTDDNGQYSIPVMEDGQYFLSCALPGDYFFSLHGLDSSVLPAAGKRSTTLVFSVANGENVTKNIGALTGNPYLSVIAFEDKNLNGGRRDSEPRIRNVKVELYYEYEGVQHLVAETTTNKDGETSISRVSPGTYFVKVTLPENYVAGPLGAKFSNYYNCINPSIDNIAYSSPFTVNYKGSTGLGVGAVTTGTLEGTLWLDKNGNQVKDSKEKGCTDAKVSLYSEALNITRTAKVNKSGSYSFTGVQPGEYKLIFELPEGMIFAGGKNSKLHDIASTASLTVQVEALKTTKAGSVGAVTASRVEIKVTDISNDETMPLANAHARFEQNGELIGTAVSDENGMLVFPLARSGEGTVSVTLPQGYVAAYEGGIFPFEKPSSEISFNVEVPLKKTYSAEGFAIASASVSGRLVEDPTNTGIITADSTPLPGFTVQAIDTDGNAVLETVTDEKGNYVLSPLMPNTYYIRFLLDDRYIATPCLSDESSEHNAIYIQEPLFGETDAIVLYDGQQKQSVNGALFRAGSVEGNVLLNPAMDNLATNVGGASGVTVTLLDEDMNIWQDYAYDITDDNGFFCIKGILPGTYSLQYELKKDQAFVTPNTSGSLFISEPFQIENGSQIQQQSIGVVTTSTIAGRVTDYTNAAGVSAKLTLTSQTIQEEIAITTDENGYYKFSGLLPGDYILSILLKNGYLFADSPASFMPYLNDNAAAVVLSLPMGTVEEGCDIIASQPVDWEIALFNDVNKNGMQDPDESMAPGRTMSLSLRSDSIGTYTSDENGIIRLSGVIPAQYTASVDLLERESLSLQNENKCTINADGLSIALHQASEISGQVWALDGSNNGIAGIEIVLVKDQTELAGTVTDENGCYSFPNLLEGDYQLRAALPEGYLFARMQDAAARASYILSQTDGSLLFGVIPLQYGQHFTGVDIGIGGMGSIGDTAWLDENKNGMQDIGEPGLPGILIELYQHGVLAASATTDVYGRYSLTGIYPGSYEMHVTMPKELKPTIRQTEFPLVASILPEADDETVVVENVIVPSMGRNLNMDLGFVLKKKGVYPACMDDIPQKDWTPYGRTEEN